MTAIHIERSHNLGLPTARSAARRWLERAAQKFSLKVDYDEGDAQDTARFSGSGIDGTLAIAASTLRLDAKLGFLYGGFSELIRTRIAQNLDELLGQQPPAARVDTA